MSLVLKYEKWEVHGIKNSENWVIQVQVMPSWAHMCLFWPFTSIYRFKVYLISVSGQPSGFIDFLNQAILQWPWTEVLNRLRKNQKPIYFMWQSRPLVSYLNVTHLTFSCFTSHLVNLIDSVHIILKYSNCIPCLFIRYLLM